MAFEREVFGSLRRFDPVLGNVRPTPGGVDIEAFLRVVLAGRVLVYQPTAIVRHGHCHDYDSLRHQLYSYRVRLTAGLTRTLVAHPRLWRDIAVRIPRGVWFALDAHSPKNVAREATYPRELKFDELRGMAFGSFAYWRRRRDVLGGRIALSPPDPARWR